MKYFLQSDLVFSVGLTVVLCKQAPRLLVNHLSVRIAEIGCRLEYSLSVAHLSTNRSITIFQRRKKAKKKKTQQI